MTKTDFAENKVLELMLGKTRWTSGDTLPTAYVGLFTTAPTDLYTSGSPTGVECSGGSYARKSTAAADWNTAATGSTSNANAVTFVPATGAWGTVTHFGIFDAASGGNLLRWAALTASKVIGSGDTASFPAGSLVCTED